MAAFRTDGYLTKALRPITPSKAYRALADRFGQLWKASHSVAALVTDPTAKKLDDGWTPYPAGAAFKDPHTV